MAQRLEQAGLDYISVPDHPYSAGFFDAFTLLAAMVQATSRVHVFSNVANVPLRLPTVLAKTVASLDVLSGGRVEFGLGAGAFWAEIEGMGGQVRTPGQAVAAVEDAIKIIRCFWQKNALYTFDGQYSPIKGVIPGPPPAHAIGIWLGAIQPRMLELTGRLADGWLPSSMFVPAESLPEKQKRIDEAALAAGRQPSDIKRIYNVMGHIAADGPVEGFLSGPIDYWVDELTRLVVEVGMDTFIYWPGADHLNQLLLFSEEVAPRVREEVDRARVTA